MARIYLDINDESDDGRYLHACARIRDISPTSLLRRLVDAIAADQMVGSVLDDGDELAIRRPGEHRYCGPRSPFSRPLP